MVVRRIWWPDNWIYNDKVPMLLEIIGRKWRWIGQMLRKLEYSISTHCIETLKAHVGESGGVRGLGAEVFTRNFKQLTRPYPEIS